MYQVPPNPKLFKITLFSPTLLKLAVLFEWLTTCMDISDEIEVEDELRDATIALPFQSLLTLVFQ